MAPSYLLDTNILISHIRGASIPASEWVARALQKNARISISVLTIFELEKGAPTERHKREVWQTTRQFSKYPVNRQIALRAGQLYLSIPKNERNDRLNIDVLIAATAEYFGCDIVTANKRDFERLALKKVRVIAVV